MEYSPWEADSDLDIKEMGSVLRNPKDCYLFQCQNFQRTFQRWANDLRILPNIGAQKGKTMQEAGICYSLESLLLGVFFKMVARHTNKFSCSSVSKKPNF